MRVPAQSPARLRLSRSRPRHVAPWRDQTDGVRPSQLDAGEEEGEGDESEENAEDGGYAEGGDSAETSVESE